MAEIGVGLIGFGLAGRVFHAPYVMATPGLALRAVVSRDAAKVHAALPGMAVAPDVEALLARDDIDLVVVASPDELHGAHARAALASGRHVVVDKPLAPTLAEARAIAAAAQAAGRLLTVFHNRRWDADFLTLQGLVAAGRLGRIVEFESRFDRWRPQPGPVWKEARAAGIWQDLGPHLVDQALCLFGPPQAITAEIATLREGAPAPDWCAATLHYPGLAVRLHASKLAAAHGLRFAVHGTGGSWIKHGTDPQEAALAGGGTLGGERWGHDPEPGVFTPATGAPEPTPGEPGDYRRFWHALVAALNGEGPNPVPPEQALAVMAVLEAGLTSAAERRTIPLQRAS